MTQTLYTDLKIIFNKSFSIYIYIFSSEVAYKSTKKKNLIY